MKEQKVRHQRATAGYTVLGSVLSNEESAQYGVQEVFIPEDERKGRSLTWLI